jgi:hypothetical protein
MKSGLNLSSMNLALWIALFAGQVVLCLCIVRKRFHRRLYWFSMFAFFFTAKDIALLILAFWGSYASYYYAFYVGGYIESALAFATLLECGRQVLPGLNLPQKEKAFSWLGLTLAGVLIFIWAWPLSSIGYERKIEAGGYLVIAVVFIFIAAYARYLGLYWSRLLVGITVTLGALYLVEGVASAVMGHFPPDLVVYIRHIRQIANILAVISWTVVILSPWGERKLTEEALQKIEAVLATIEASLRTAARSKPL